VLDTTSHGPFQWFRAPGELTGIGATSSECLKCELAGVCIKVSSNVRTPGRTTTAGTTGKGDTMTEKKEEYEERLRAEFERDLPEKIEFEQKAREEAEEQLRDEFEKWLETQLDEVEEDEEGE